MSLRIELSDQDLEYLSEDAKEELKRSTVSYAVEIMREAARIETSLRNGENDRPEITRNIIKEAVKFNKNLYRRTAGSRKAKGLQILSALSALITGVLFDFDEIKTNTTLLVFFLLSLCVAVATTVLVYTGSDER